MIPAVGADNAAHFVLLQGKTGILKGLLHIPTPKESQIPTHSVGSAIAAFQGVLGKGFDNPLGLDLGLVLLELRHGVLGTQRDLLTRSATDRIATASVLDE